MMVSVLCLAQIMELSHLFLHPVKIGDMNAAYLLLHWGADPNTIDNSGDSAMLWVIRNRYIFTFLWQYEEQYIIFKFLLLMMLRSGHATLELVRLLLRFGADPLFCNANDGCSAFHILAQRPKGTELALAHALFQAAAVLNRSTMVTSSTNAEGYTPYTVRLHYCNLFTYVLSTF